MYSFPDLEPGCCSMLTSNCYFLTCIQISQKASKVVWYSHLFKNFPEFVVVIVNKADVFLEFSYFFYDPVDVGNLASRSSAFSKTSLNIWKFTGKKTPRFQKEILKPNRTNGKGKLYRKQKTDSTEEPATIFLCTWQVSVKTEDLGRV